MFMVPLTMFVYFSALEFKLLKCKAMSSLVYSSLRVQTIKV